MFRHQGKNRTFIHNLRLVLYYLCCWYCKCYGVLSVQTLTTNITGHFAYFEEIMKRDYAAAIPFVFTVFFFVWCFYI
jgi:hypothetical protein